MAPTFKSSCPSCNSNGVSFYSSSTMNVLGSGINFLQRWRQPFTAVASTFTAVASTIAVGAWASYNERGGTFGPKRFLIDKARCDRRTVPYLFLVDIFLTDWRRELPNHRINHCIKTLHKPLQLRSYSISTMVSHLCCTISTIVKPSDRSPG